MGNAPNAGQTVRGDKRPANDGSRYSVHCAGVRDLIRSDPFLSEFHFGHDISGKLRLANPCRPPVLIMGRRITHRHGRDKPESLLHGGKTAPGGEPPALALTDCSVIRFGSTLRQTL